MSFQNVDEDETDKNTGMLLNLSQKSSIFVADQTPTPTRLIKNCEEVGLFEDLQNVNPFDETFRRACEQNVQNTPSNHSHTLHADENSLHTPQVFPQFDTAVEGGIVAEEDLAKQTLDTPVDLNVETVETILNTPLLTNYNKCKSFESCPIKYRPIAEKPPAVNVQQTLGITFLPPTVQFVQPQVITVTFPNSATVTHLNTSANEQQILAAQEKKSATKTKPLILPKLATTNTTSTKDTVTYTPNTPQPEPSSASLTPTSQLPIKERLKAILSQSSKARPTDWYDKSSYNTSTKIYSKNSNSKLNTAHKTSKDDAMERRRAASTRYRHKMRNEYKELRTRNAELKTENEKLKEKIKQLEGENSQLKTASLQPVLSPSTLPSALGVPAQIQIPASTVHLVMNIPKMVVPCGTSELNTSTLLKNR